MKNLAATISRIVRDSVRAVWVQYRNRERQKRYVSDALFLGVRVAFVGTAVAFLFYMLLVIMSIGDVTVSALALIGTSFILYTLTDKLYRDGGLFAFVASFSLPVVAAYTIPMIVLDMPSEVMMAVTMPFVLGLLISMYFPAMVIRGLFLMVSRKSPAPAVTAATPLPLNEQKLEVAS